MAENTDTTPAKAHDKRQPKQKVPAFARYEGTSAWRKDRRRVRAYALHKAALQQAAQGKAST